MIQRGEFVPRLLVIEQPAEAIFEGFAIPGVGLPDIEAPVLDELDGGNAVGGIVADSRFGKDRGLGRKRKISRLGPVVALVEDNVVGLVFGLDQNPIEVRSLGQGIGIGHLLERGARPTVVHVGFAIPIVGKAVFAIRLKVNVIILRCFAVFGEQLGVLLDRDRGIRKGILIIVVPAFENFSFDDRVLGMEKAQVIGFDDRRFPFDMEGDAHRHRIADSFDNRIPAFRISGRD